MFPMPDMSVHIEEILTYALAWLDALDNQKFLWILAAFNLVVMAIVWIIHTVRHPPRLDT